MNVILSEYYPPVNDLKIIASTGALYLLVDVNDPLGNTDPEKKGYLWNSRSRVLYEPQRIQVMAKFINFVNDNSKYIPNYPHHGELDDDKHRGATGEVRQRIEDEIDEFMDNGGIDDQPHTPIKKAINVLQKADFDESKHPRDKGGEFAPKGEGEGKGAEEHRHRDKEREPVVLGGGTGWMGSAGKPYDPKTRTGGGAGFGHYRMKEEKEEPEPPDERFEPLPDFKHGEIPTKSIEQIDPHEVEPTWANPTGKSRYGGVIMSEDGKKVLLREPTGHFDGYAWTFSKGTPDPGDHPVETAVREVAEETGHDGKIVGFVPGKFSSGNSTTYYFLMHSRGNNPESMDEETNDTRWVTEDEARELINQSTNYMGKKRDLATLKAAFKYDNALRSGHADNKKLVEAIENKKVDGKDVRWNPMKYQEPDKPLPPGTQPHDTSHAFYKPFDYDAERAEALDGGDNDTKSQFIIRNGAVKDADKFKYSNGMSTKEFIDGAIRDGFTRIGAIVEDGKHKITLTNPKTNIEYTLDRKVETRYARVLFNFGGFSGDYKRIAQEKKEREEKRKQEQTEREKKHAEGKGKTPPPPDLESHWWERIKKADGGDWDETKHPRAKGGEFAPKGEGGGGGGHEPERKMPKRMHMGGGRFTSIGTGEPEKPEEKPAEPEKPKTSPGYTGFNEEAERNMVMDGMKTKAGITREQAVRFFNRRNAVQDAAKFRYKDGTTAKSVIDGYVSRGFEHKRVKRGVATISTLDSPDGKESYVFKRPEETAYIQTIFNEGAYAKNYGDAEAKPAAEEPKAEAKPAAEPEKPKEEPKPKAPPEHPFTKDEQVLKAAKFTNRRKIGTGITSPDVADVVGDGKAVIKAKPEWDSFGTPQTEYAIYDLSKEIGFNSVPPTVLHPDGSSVMKFIPNCEVGRISERPGAKALDTFSKIAVMDIVTGNTDRKSWNWLYSKDDHDFVQIDNGYSFILPVRTPRSSTPETGRPIRNFPVESCCDYAESTMAGAYRDVLGLSGKFQVKKEHVDAMKNFVASGKHKTFLAKHFSGKMLESAIRQMEVGVQRLDSLSSGEVI